MDSAAQPILCCLGESIEGRATQFCVQRVIETRHLDWQVISSEVHADDLEVAIRGLAAIGVSAFRFFGKLQNQAATIFSALSIEADSTANNTVAAPISSVARTDTGWECWFSIAEVLENNLKADQTSEISASRGLSDYNWLVCGRSRLTIAVENKLRTIVPEDQLHITESPGELSNRPSLLAPPTANLQKVAPDTQEAVEAPASDSARDAINSEPSICIVLSSEQFVAPILDALGETPGVWIARDEVIDAVSRQLASDDASQSHRLLRRSELGFEGDVYDIRRWMGVEADINVIQDAYDEFSAF